MNLLRKCGFFITLLSVFLGILGIAIWLYQSHPAAVVVEPNSGRWLPVHYDTPASSLHPGDIVHIKCPTMIYSEMVVGSLPPSHNFQTVIIVDSDLKKGLYPFWSSRGDTVIRGEIFVP
jgi:hypothetical protein